METSRRSSFCLSCSTPCEIFAVVVVLLQGAFVETVEEQ